MGHYYAKFSCNYHTCCRRLVKYSSDIPPVFEKYGSTCLSSVTFLDALPIFWISDADAVKTVQNLRTTFTKDTEAVSLEILPKNINS